MRRDFQPGQRAERSITTTFRKTIWNPFARAVREYALIEPGDRVAVCISGGKDSMLLAKLIQQLQRNGEIPFEAVYLVMDPGYNEINRRKIESNAALLQVPITIFETNIFRVANQTEKDPCYLCARMRRGHLYNKAQEMGCNKIALGHHMNDVIETVVMGMFYSSMLQTMPPKLHSDNFPGMEVIRPMYRVREEAVLAWRDANGLEFIQCACRFTENTARSADGIGFSKRQEIKLLLRELKKKNSYIEKSIFNGIHSVSIDSFPGYKSRGTHHSFLETYEHETPIGPMDGVRREELQAILDAEAENGTDELEAYRTLARALGLSFPKE